MFENSRIMKYYLFNRIKMEKAKFWFAARKREFNKSNIRELEETIDDKYALDLGKCITSRRLVFCNIFFL